jgi:hypothetical protein
LARKAQREQYKCRQKQKLSEWIAEKDAALAALHYQSLHLSPECLTGNLRESGVFILRMTTDAPFMIRH